MSGNEERQNRMTPKPLRLSQTGRTREMVFDPKLVILYLE